ncbi:MAG: hypothetical protein AAB403_02995, partial [Planctomycetota bacterium]
ILTGKNTDYQRSVGLPSFVGIVSPAGLAVTAALVQMHCLQDTCVYQCHAYNRHNYNKALNLLHNSFLSVKPCKFIE